MSDASYEDRNAVLLSARAELARDYIALRDTQSLLRIARQNLQIARDTTKLTQIRVREGVTTDLDVANASAQVASIESLIPTLESRCETTINAIGVLLGEKPGALAQTLGEPHDVPELPPRMPIGFPSAVSGRGVGLPTGIKCGVASCSLLIDNRVRSSAFSPALSPITPF
jgi:outer membrane protein TolC